MKTFQIANTILDMAFKNKKEISPFKLQSLMYFCHGWYFALYNKILIEEGFLYGEKEPFHRDLYMRLKHIGSHLIMDPIYYYDPAEDAYFCDRIKDDVILDTVRTVWDIFSKYNDRDLHKFLTDDKSPWGKNHTEKEVLSNIENVDIRNHLLQFVQTVIQE